MRGTLVGTWTSLIPGCVISLALQCNADESQFPSQPRVQLVAPGASWQVLSLAQGCRCQLYIAQSCDDPLGLSLRHANPKSCVHGARFALLLWARVQRISLPLVVMTCFSSCNDTTNWARNWKSCRLFSSLLRNCCQFCGIWLFASSCGL